jgi:hypothetical protein
MSNDISFAIVFFGSLALQGSKKNLLRNVLLVACPVVVVFTTSTPWEVLAVNTGNGYHLLRKTSMAAVTPTFYNNKILSD